MPSSYLISEGERRFIAGGVELDMRSDGRRAGDYQAILLETDVVHNCDGSSHIRCGKNDVMVGVKLEIDSIAISDSGDQKNAGRIEFFADVTANASPEFEGRHGEDISNELQTLMADVVPQALDLESLVVVEGKSCFVIRVDIVVLEFGSRSSLIDTTSLAVKAAFFDTKIPKVIVDPEDPTDFQISDDVFECRRLDVSLVPVFVTCTRISSNYIVDVTAEEEASAISSVTFAVSPKHGVVYVKKLGSGSLHPDPMKEVMTWAQQIGVKQNGQLMTLVENNYDTSGSGQLTFIK